MTLGTAAGTATSINANQFYDLKGGLVRSTCATDVSTKVL